MHYILIFLRKYSDYCLISNIGVILAKHRPSVVAIAYSQLEERKLAGAKSYSLRSPPVTFISSTLIVSKVLRLNSALPEKKLNSSTTRTFPGIGSSVFLIVENLEYGCLLSVKTSIYRPPT